MEPILIIESPGLSDITTGDREGQHLHGLLQILRIPSTYLPIHSDKLLGERLAEHAPKHAVIHLAAHGSKQGLGFTDGSLTEWAELSALLTFAAADKLVVLSSCHSSEMPKPDTQDTLAAIVTKALGLKPSPPRAILTIFSTVAFYDCVLAWGVFYRHLSMRIAKHGAAIASCEPRWIFESLNAVKNADLPTVKICATFWYEKYGKHVDISPWHEDGPTNLRSLATGAAPKTPRA